MNPGLTEEAGQTARSVVKVLESQPLALAMIISNLILLGFLFYTQGQNNEAWKQNNEQRSELGKSILHFHSETQQLLARCVVPGTP